MQENTYRTIRNQFGSSKRGKDSVLFNPHAMYEQRGVREHTGEAVCSRRSHAVWLLTRQSDGIVFAQENKKIN